MKKNKVSVSEKKIGSDTEIGPWFRFPIPKPGFGRTLKHAPSERISHHCARAAATAQSSPHSKQKTFEFFCSFVLKIMTSVKKGKQPC